MDALDAANCTSIFDKFPQREMTVIGAKGVYLSGYSKECEYRHYG